MTFATGVCNMTERRVFQVVWSFGCIKSHDFGLIFLASMRSSLAVWLKGASRQQANKDTSTDSLWLVCAVKITIEQHSFLNWTMWFFLGVSHMWGGLSPQWHLLNITCGTSGLVTLLGGSRKCLSLIGRVGRDVHDSVLPTSHWQAWKTWKHTKKEIEAKATKAGVIWFCQWGRSGAAHLGHQQQGLRSPRMSHTKKPLVLVMMGHLFFVFS